MIRTCTGWISPAASAANVLGSRAATVHAQAIWSAADCQVIWDAPLPPGGPG